MYLDSSPTAQNDKSNIVMLSGAKHLGIHGDSWDSSPSRAQNDNVVMLRAQPETSRDSSGGALRMTKEIVMLSETKHLMYLDSSPTAQNDKSNIVMLNGAKHLVKRNIPCQNIPKPN